MFTQEGKTEKLGLREEKKKANRRLLIRAAEELFIEKGLEQTTVADIIERSGLARGTFYNYFSRKEDVWRYLLMKMLQKSHELTTRKTEKAGTLEEFLYYSFLSYLQVIMTDETTTALVMRNQVAFRSTLLSGDDAFTVTGILEKNLRESGYFDPMDDAELKLLVFAAIGAGLEVVVQTFIQKIPSTPESLAQFLTSLFLSGIRQNYSL